MKPFENHLKKLADQDQLRSLCPITGIDFCSNDYLALSKHPTIVHSIKQALENSVTIGAGASRLLRGNHPAHIELETSAASFFGTERALFMANGFIANYALLTTLPQRGDTIIFDQLCHASMRDGIQASNAKNIKVPHNDLTAFEAALQKTQGQKWVCTESVFSMDGDRAPITKLLELAEKYDATLLLDAAHEIPAAHKYSSDRLITLHTCGKALGVEGALICANETVIDYLINCARPFIYSTAPSPLIATAVLAAFKVLQNEPERIEKLTGLINFAHQTLAPIAQTTNHGTPIIPIIIGDNAKTLSIAEQLQNEGFDIRAIRPPTVPEGTSRLRLTVNIGQTREEWQKCVAILSKLMENAAA